MEHALDNPVWNALISGNQHLASGSDRVKFFDEQVSPFAGLCENSPNNLLELHELCQSDRPVLVWANELLSFPEPWMVVDTIKGFQMVYDNTIVNAGAGTEITALSEKNIPEMLSLTRLTRPGPFGARTIEFGNYEGIFENGQLVAMTGQRFRCFNHIEISAVCTHPAYLGRGYAKQLLLSQLTQILALSCKPYLHVRADNDRAIQVYQSLGFLVRMPVYFYVIRKRV